MSKDAFPKIRLCTVVKIQSGISPVSYAPAEESTGQWIVIKRAIFVFPDSCSERTCAIFNPDASSWFSDSASSWLLCLFLEP